MRAEQEYSVAPRVVKGFTAQRVSRVKWLPRRSIGGWALPRVAAVNIEASPSTAAPPKPSPTRRSLSPARRRHLPHATLPVATLLPPLSKGASESPSNAAALSPLPLPLPGAKQKKRQQRRSWKDERGYRTWFLEQLMDVDVAAGRGGGGASALPATVVVVAGAGAAAVALAAAAESSARVALAEAAVDATATVAMVQDDALLDDEDEDDGWVDEDLTPLADVVALRADFQRGMRETREEGTRALKIIILAGE